MTSLTILSLLFVCISVVASENLPSYGWFTRKIVSLAGVDMVITKTGPNTFNFENLTIKKDLIYKDIQLGKEFIGEGLDSTDHKITFTLRNGALYEKHIPTDPESEQKEDEYKFEIVKDELVQTLQFNGVVAKRYFTTEEVFEFNMY